MLLVLLIAISVCNFAFATLMPPLSGGIALLVALYFMHLRFETNRLRILAIAPLPLAVIMILAVITEYVW